MAASAVPIDATVERLAAKYAKDAIIKLQTGDKEVKGGKTQRVYGMVGRVISVSKIERHQCVEVRYRECGEN